MDLAPDARTYARWNYTADYDPTGDVITVLIDGVPHPAFDFTTAPDPCQAGRWAGVVRLLVAGPDAVGNPGATVVLALGTHTVALSFPNAPSQTLLDGGTIDVIAAVAGMASGPCSAWEPDACVVFPDCTAMVSGYALDAATEVLWTRTGRRFGVCQVAYRPCRAACASNWWASPPWGSWGGSSWGGGGSWGWPYPALIGGRWVNLGCGACGDTCSCTILHQIALPSPVAGIVAVKVDGATLPASAYRVDNWNTLVRLDGEAWPRCNDLNLADTEDGTWSVTALYGEAVPALGRLAVGVLAVYLATGLCASAGCRLHSATVTEITRQGVQKRFASARSVKDGSLISTGLYLPDLFIETFNPTHSSPAAIYDLDAARPRRTGTS